MSPVPLPSEIVENTKSFTKKEDIIILDYEPKKIYVGVYKNLFRVYDSPEKNCFLDFEVNDVELLAKILYGFQKNTVDYCRLSCIINDQSIEAKILFPRYSEIDSHRYLNEIFAKENFWQDYAETVTIKAAHNEAKFAIQRIDGKFKLCIGSGSYIFETYNDLMSIVNPWISDHGVTTEITYKTGAKFILQYIVPDFRSSTSDYMKILELNFK